MIGMKVHSASVPAFRGVSCGRPKGQGAATDATSFRKKTPFDHVPTFALANPRRGGFETRPWPRVDNACTASCNDTTRRTGDTRYPSWGARGVHARHLHLLTGKPTPLPSCRTPDPVPSVGRVLAAHPLPPTTPNRLATFILPPSTNRGNPVSTRRRRSAATPTQLSSSPPIGDPGKCSPRNSETRSVTKLYS